MKEKDIRIIESVIGFVASIMDEVDCDIKIDDDFTIGDGWNEYIRPLQSLVVRLKREIEETR